MATGIGGDGVSARFTVVQSDAGPILSVSGALDVAATALLWTDLLRATKPAAGAPLTVDLSALESCDTAGATLLLEAERAHGGETTVKGVTDKVAAVIALVRPAAGPATPPAPKPPTRWRDGLTGGLKVVTDQLVYLGEVALATVQVGGRRRMFRGRDLLRIADEVGVQAIPLVLLIGVLIGVILAYQSLVPMRRFGADLYVANLVAVGLLRELGPLLTAVVLSGRSGSAFAAEIGTMKVNQELDALATMGIDVTTFLILPRLLAATAMMPLLTVMMELAGLLGMTVVLTANGIPPVTIANQISNTLVPLDFYGGIFKASLFGVAVAAVGCRAGLATGVGPRAVGASATAAVVGGIVAAIVIDGGLAVIFTRLGI